MVNVNKLKGRIVEEGMNIPELAEKIGRDKATLYRKLKQDGEQVTIKEADLIGKALNMTLEDFSSTFFAQYVAQDAKKDRNTIQR